MKATKITRNTDDESTLETINVACQYEDNCELAREFKDRPTTPQKLIETLEKKGSFSMQNRSYANPHCRYARGERSCSVPSAVAEHKGLFLLEAKLLEDLAKVQELKDDYISDIPKPEFVE